MVGTIDWVVVLAVAFSCFGGEGVVMNPVVLLVVFVELTPLGAWVGVVSGAFVGFTKPGFQHGLLKTSP